MLSTRVFPLICRRGALRRPLISHQIERSDGFSSAPPVTSGPTESKKLSKAMKAYLERSKAYGEFIQKEEAEFNTGKRHLANMMGMDPETITQQQIDEAIEYLFPSGLFEKKARPFMKPPHLVFPPRKAAEFDESGRPHHFLFYTGKPNLYAALHEAVKQMRLLNAYEDDLIRKGQDEKGLPFDTSGSEWINKQNLEKKIVEELTEVEYQNFITAMDRLVAHKYSNNAAEFIRSWRRQLMVKNKDSEIPKPEVREDGKLFVTSKDCPRKSARADVTVINPGTGKVTVNGKDITYFKSIQSRNQILFPLELTGLKDSVDVEATVTGGGETGQAGAIRLGVARGLRSFVSPEMVETMRLAGLLQQDFRRRERKKPGQAKARKKFTWKKR